MTAQRWRVCERKKRWRAPSLQVCRIWASANIFKVYLSLSGLWAPVKQTNLNHLPLAVDPLLIGRLGNMEAVS